MFTIYATNHPAGLTANVVTTAANKGVLLALVAMAQTLRRADRRHRPLGRHGLRALPIASPRGSSCGSPLEDRARRRSACWSAGLACGALNGLIVIYGRLQPIVTTIATGAIYYGIALALRPVPGGDDQSDSGRRADRQVAGGVPASLSLLLVVVLVVWVPFRRSVLGRAAYAVGSSETAAYMSGVPIRRAKFLAYTLSGLLAAIGGLFLTFFTYSGEASAANGSTYTLNSIAAVVLGGVSLFGGVGSAIGAIFGAFVFRTIGDLLFVFDLEPLVAAAVPGRRAARRRVAWAPSGCCASATGWICSGEARR